MSNDNKRNLRYFESTSMRELYNDMENWQNDNNKRLLSTNIQKDGDMFCCIALTNPSEVIIADSKFSTLDGHLARVENGRLMVKY